jgi:hypothetical protein
MERPLQPRARRALLEETKHGGKGRTGLLCRQFRLSAISRLRKGGFEPSWNWLMHLDRLAGLVDGDQPV